MKKILNLMLILCFSCLMFATQNYNKTASAISQTTIIKPKMAIVIDDFGSYDQSGVLKLAECKVPLTCAVLPFVDNSKQNAELMTNNGHEVILHMPMQSHITLPESWYGPICIRCSDTKEMATNKLQKCLAEFPCAKGFNVHIGSGVTQNKQLMKTIYEFANQNNLFFLDSRTIETKATEDAAKETNSIYLGRDVFLEADKNKSYAGVKHRLIEGANIALDKGYSIVIGHVGAEGGENTANAIIDTIPLLEKMGIQIVPLSEIYKIAKDYNQICKN
jgi:polysaccharide deacetylase 2 family uncharacterized protein YibQ